MEKLLMEINFIGGPAVCIMGRRCTAGEELCMELRAAILSPKQEVHHKFLATGAEFRTEENIYEVFAPSIESVELLSQLLKNKRMQIEPFSRDDLEGFSISPTTR